jgi:hypothetical protein
MYSCYNSDTALGPRVMKTVEFHRTVNELYTGWRSRCMHSNTRDRDDLRFGQYVINTGRLASVIPDPWSEIFYEEDPQKVYMKLYEFSLTLE